MVYGLHHFSLQVFVGFGVIIDSSGIRIMPKYSILKIIGTNSKIVGFLSK